jgi:CheY-like chemotaxis protein
VLDARMPEEGGLSIAEAGGCVDRPRVIVLLSMNHRPDDYAKCAAAAAHPLLKPLRRETLVEAVGGASPKTVEPDPTLPTKLGSLKLLLAEDSVDNRALVEAFLRDTDVELRCVETGADALRVVLEEEFDLILMDVSMPEMDGHEATRGFARGNASRARERSRSWP